MRIKLAEFFILENASVFPPNTNQIEADSVKSKMAEAWRTLEKKVRKEYGYPNLSMFIFDTDDAGVLWAINDHNLYWNDNSKEWVEWEDDQPPHWSNS